MSVCTMVSANGLATFSMITMQLGTIQLGGLKSQVSTKDKIPVSHLSATHFLQVYLGNHLGDHFQANYNYMAWNLIKIFLTKILRSTLV